MEAANPVYNHKYQMLQQIHA